MNSGPRCNVKSDDDPGLAGQALPFSLELIESLMAESPRHKRLLPAAASGFTKCAYAYISSPAKQPRKASSAERKEVAK